jgi:hypothetical protein
MITTRTLQQWRRDSLRNLSNPYMKMDQTNPDSITTDLIHFHESNERILRLTQELLDLNLLKKG